MTEKNLLDEGYKLARSFMEWLDLSKQPNPDLDEVHGSWRRVMMQEEVVRKLMDGTEDEPCKDCPDEDS